MNHADQSTVAVASAQQSGGASGAGGSSAGGGAGGGMGGGMSGGSSGGMSGGMGEGGAIPPFLIPYLKKVNHMTIAHGVLMCLAFVIFMPTGAIVIRLGKFKGVVNVHAGIQAFAYMMALAGMGIGLWVAHVPTKFGRENQVSHFSSAHAAPWMATEADRLHIDTQVPPHHRPHHHRWSILPTHSRRSPPCRLRQRTPEIHLVYSTRLVGPNFHDVRLHPRWSGLEVRQQHDGRQDRVRGCCGRDLAHLDQCGSVA